jgi:predicted small lipoprotein YifL
MKRVLILLMVILSVFVLSACGEATLEDKTSDQVQSEKAERVNKQKTMRVGEPSITNFYEANQVKEIYEKRDNAELLCYAYVKNLEGRFIYLGVSKGYGVNSSIQFSNPVKVQRAENDYGIWAGDGDGPILVPQAEPNGLFMPEGLMATYINILDENTGEFGLSYIEDNLNVFENKLPRRLVVDWSLPEDYDTIEAPSEEDSE